MIMGFAKVLAGLAAAFVWAGDKYTQEQLDARFYFDLGPAEVDVSRYPKKQQENYAVFQKTCSQCHTLARSINAPISGRNWERYVQRRHLRSKTHPEVSISKAEAKAILDFLEYDSLKRKVEQRRTFDAKNRELQRLFEDVKKERSRIQIEEDEKKAKPMPPGAGEHP